MTPTDSDRSCEEWLSKLIGWNRNSSPGPISRSQSSGESSRKRRRMTADWRTLCRGRDLTVDKDMIVVMLPGGRQQRISVSDNDDAYWLTTVVARPAVASTVANLPLRAWERNRATRLVAFKIDMRGRLKAESW